MTLQRRMLLPALLLCLFPLKAAFCAPQNAVTAIKTVRSNPSIVTYNITVTSTDEFPMNDSVVTLSVGGKEFINSSYGPDGTLHSLVFSLTRTQFLGLKTGDPVLVYYGASNAALSAAQWDFGTLDLSLLDKPAATTPTATPGK